MFIRSLSLVSLTLALFLGVAGACAAEQITASPQVAFRLAPAQNDGSLYGVRALAAMTGEFDALTIMPGQLNAPGFDAGSGPLANQFASLAPISAAAQDLTGHFDANGTGHLLSAAAINSPYVALTSNSHYFGSTIALADDLQVHFGQSVVGPERLEYQVPEFSYLADVRGPQSQLDTRQAQSSLASVDWDFASWGGVGAFASQSSERNGLLGSFGASAKSANRSAVGVSARVGFGDGWVTTFSYNEGVTQLNLKADALLSTTDTLHSRVYGVAVAKHGLFDDDDSLGLAVSRPLQIYGGSANIAAADGVDPNNFMIGHQYASLSNSTPETDLELGYVTTFMDGALALQANAGYQMNVAGLGGTNAVSVISRAKINF